MTVFARSEKPELSGDRRMTPDAKRVYNDDSAQYVIEGGIMSTKRTIRALLVLTFAVVIPILIIRASRRKAALEEQVIEPVEGTVELGRETLNEAVHHAREVSQKMFHNLQHTFEKAREDVEDRLKDAQN
jgi:hypothetical protein